MTAAQEARTALTPQLSNAMADAVGLGYTPETFTRYVDAVFPIIWKARGEVDRAAVAALPKINDGLTVWADAQVAIAALDEQ